MDASQRVARPVGLWVWECAAPRDLRRLNFHADSALVESRALRLIDPSAKVAPRQIPCRVIRRGAQGVGL